MIKAGWTMTVLLAAFMLLASVVPKLLNAEVAIEPMVRIGWPTMHLQLIGIIELVCMLLFLLPRTALLGAVLFTALLGGAIASQWRVGSPLFGYTLFGVYLGIFMWVALWLREPKLRQLFPFVR